MGQIDDKKFLIKEDGTIIRRPKKSKQVSKINDATRKRKIERLKKDLTERESVKTNEDCFDIEDNDGCLSGLTKFVFLLIVTSLIGGVIGYFVDGTEGFKNGLFYGAFIGIILIEIIVQEI